MLHVKTDCSKLIHTEFDTKKQKQSYVPVMRDHK